MNDNRVGRGTLERLRKGDTKAFEQVFLAYYNRIRIFIGAIIKSETDAEDLAQDIFAKLWHGRAAIDEGKSFTSYMYTMARNAAFNYLKHLSVCHSYLNKHIHADVDISPEDIMYAKEIRLLAEMVVSQMPEQRKKIYTLSRNQGLTNDEIASQLGISKKTVENQLSLALQAIRKGIAALALFLA